MVETTWLAWPTLKEGNTLRPIKGTSHYQPAIEAAARGRTETGPNVDLVMAELRTVQDGQYAGAVAVVNAGRKWERVPVENGSALVGS